MMIIGLTGRIAAGKGAVSEFLQQAGFAYFSLSDAIRHELKRRGVAESRDALTRVGNELRRSYGPAALALKIAPLIAPAQSTVIDSIRNPAEVEALREKIPGFVLWEVCAPASLRFERLRSRGRVGDVSTLAEFEAQEARELASADPNRQQLTATAALADDVLDNGGDLAALRAAVERAMGRVSGQ